jgi:hypothetical protein
MLTQK